MHELVIAPSGRLNLVVSSRPEAAELPPAVIAAFAEGSARGLLHLATRELSTRLPPALEAARSFAASYLNRVCREQGRDTSRKLPPTPPPDEAELATWILQAPPITGLENLSTAALGSWWTDLDALVRDEIGSHVGGAQAYLSEKNPAWRFVGRVTLHLAENKRDEDNPFAFLATYVSRLSPQGRIQHEPLGRALRQYADEGDRATLAALLEPLDRASGRSTLVRQLVDSGDVYHPLAWTSREAYRFLQDVPILEESGLLVRVPDWWKAGHPARAVVNVQIDAREGARLGVDALLDFSVDVALNGETLDEDELQELLDSAGGLVRFRGQWVEVDRSKLAEALAHWKQVESKVRREGLRFYEGMRLLAGATREPDAAADVPVATREWTGLHAGPALEALLARAAAPETRTLAEPVGLQAELRPYQRTGLSWLHFLTGLGLGACLADDMGLGKTIQVIALLLQWKEEDRGDCRLQIADCRLSNAAGTAALPGAADCRVERQSSTPQSAICNLQSAIPSLLVVPASLIANWKAEIERFAPSLKFAIAHPSELPAGQDDLTDADLRGLDLVITTYGMLTRKANLRRRKWRLVVLDEAQAIKNSGTKQTRAAKDLQAGARVALTGTPVENRLSDLWSLFDFLNPGLLGGAREFARFVHRLEEAPGRSYRPLRALVGPYILRRLKTDKRVIADLPDKTEVKAYCGLSRRQAALYQQAVRDLERELHRAEGIGRRGVVLAQLLRLKQICNHPDQALGLGAFEPAQSGKFLRLAELCEEMAARQERALVFTQFREIAEPLATFLAGVFGRPGLVLHGGTPLPRRRELVAEFQRDDGSPFFVLSVKAGGTGLNLTAASQVVHFDRWWNPAVENQATDRAFRIGQRRNVLVHKFVCRGTVEERIDALLASKADLLQGVVEGGERLLTEMPNEELLAFVALDIHKALD